MVKAYSGRLSPLCAGLVLLACSCQTRNFALQKSETGQESEKSPPALPIVWDDEGPAEGYEMQAPKLYLAVYDRFRQNPDGNFAVPEFKPQARKLLALLRSVQDRLNANEFPLRILVPKDFPGAQKKIESIKSSVTKECFVGAAEKVQKLLMPPEGREFTYASFWTGFRLASRAMVNPCPIANGEDVQEVRRLGNTDKFFPLYGVGGGFRSPESWPFNAQITLGYDGLGNKDYKGFYCDTEIMYELPAFVAAVTSLGLFDRAWVSLYVRAHRHSFRVKSEVTSSTLAVAEGVAGLGYRLEFL